jgi:hypothetical protein
MYLALSLSCPSHSKPRSLHTPPPIYETEQQQEQKNKDDKKRKKITKHNRHEMAVLLDGFENGWRCLRNSTEREDTNGYRRGQNR